MNVKKILASTALSASILGLISPSLATGRQVEASGGPIEAAQSQNGDSADPSSDQAVTYQVQQSDNLYRIGQNYNVTVSQLMSWNDLGPNDVIQPGDSLVIYPGQDQSQADSQAGGQDYYYTVKPQQGLWRIAQETNKSVEDIKEWNNLGPNDTIHPGDQLLIKEGIKDYQEQGLEDPDYLPTHLGPYEVEPGDSLWSIATKFGDSMEEMMARNGITADTLIQPGDVIIVEADELRWVPDTNYQSLNPKDYTQAALDRIHEATDYQYKPVDFAYSTEVINGETLEITIYKDHPERLTAENRFRYNTRTGQLFQQDVASGPDEWVEQ